MTPVTGQQFRETQDYSPEETLGQVDVEPPNPPRRAEYTRGRKMICNYEIIRPGRERERCVVLAVIGGTV